MQIIATEVGFRRNALFSNWLEFFINALQIEGVDPDNARVMVKLAIGGKTVTVSQYAVKLVGSKEYDKYSKDLSESIWTRTGTKSHHLLFYRKHVDAVLKRSLH